MEHLNKNVQEELARYQVLNMQEEDKVNCLVLKLITSEMMVEAREVVGSY